MEDTSAKLQLDENLLRLAKEAFNEFDKNKSGTIDHRELTTVLRTLGQNPSDSEVNDMINEVDVDGSGVIEFKEFIKFMGRLTIEGDRMNEAQECFRRFDPDNIGNISVEELKYVLTHLPIQVSESEANEIIKAADINEDGTIDFEEFKNMLGVDIE